MAEPREQQPNNGSRQCDMGRSQHGARRVTVVVYVWAVPNSIKKAEQRPRNGQGAARGEGPLDHERSLTSGRLGVW